eukprot:CAMPEP_0172519154 /NCGR_PEP_ID=MMETSP1066-20121228/291244_1 /TAXON_ID=671091 /ORGANISM="Coscinodiscus wailesii, Strain CCMP2513" /LENGTH=176 /DNA_ID=CAMNT_0013301681 /DNA_START=1891 /DNA_END=2421 /DNA_ORIENTATION=+
MAKRYHSTLCCILILSLSISFVSQSSMAAANVLFASNDETLPHPFIGPKERPRAPEWMYELQSFRKQLFLKTVEPIIVYLLGPVETEEAPTENRHHQKTHNSSSTVPEALSNDIVRTAETATSPAPRRRLGFLPNYVEDVSKFRETSVSFATLAMLFVMMIGLMLLFQCAIARAYR